VAFYPPSLGLVGGGQNRDLDPMQQGILRLFYGGDVEDPFLVVGTPCPSQQRIQECGRHDHTLAGPGECGELPLCLILHHGLACL
jgi:hypothetical protein